MIGIVFWQAIFFIGLILVAILKFRDGLDISKTLIAAVIAIFLSFVGSVLLVNLGLISYNTKHVAMTILRTPGFQHLSSGAIAMIMVHFAPENRKTIIPFLSAIALITDLIVFISVQADVIKFLNWNYFYNFIFDLFALGIVYFLYELILSRTNRVTGK